MRPLAGIQVVEVSMWAYVPSCGAVLADWGAEVVKIEPRQGDPMRALTTSGIPPGTNGLTFMWEILNRGKRSVVMDLRAEGAAGILYRLVEEADVFLVSLLARIQQLSTTLHDFGGSPTPTTVTSGRPISSAHMRGASASKQGHHETHDVEHRSESQGPCTASRTPTRPSPHPQTRSAALAHSSRTERPGAG